MAGDVNLSISNDVIKSIVDSKIRANVASALMEQSSLLVEKLTENIITQRVDSQGRPSTYSGDKTTLLDYLVSQEIRRIAEVLIQEWVVSNKDKLAISMRKSLDKNKDKFTDSLIQNLIDQTKSGIKYDLTVITAGSQRSLYGRMSTLERKAGL